MKMHSSETAKLTIGQKLLRQAVHEIDDYFGEGTAVKDTALLGHYVQALAFLEVKETLRTKL